MSLSINSLALMPEIPINSLSRETAGGSFPEVLEQKRNVYQELELIKDKLNRGQELQLESLLLYQMKAGEFNLKIELVSKVAETFVATGRRLQQQV